MYNMENSNVKLENNNEHQLIIGKTYYSWDLDGGWWAIGKHIGGRREEKASQINDVATIISFEIRREGGYHENYGWCYYKDNNRSYRIATDEEREWLDVCIAAGRMICKEDALKNYCNYQIY